MKTFEIRTPDGRILRHRHASLEAASAALVPGYRVVGEVIGASANGDGGWLAPIDGPSVMAMLLAAHGDELVAWLEAKGVINADRAAKSAD